MKTFEQYIFENKMLNDNQLNIAFVDAKKYLMSVHKKITEEHIIDFMIGYMFNNYGLDFTHGKHIYRYIKHYVHFKLKEKITKNEKIIERITMKTYEQFILEGVEPTGFLKSAHPSTTR